MLRRGRRVGGTAAPSGKRMIARPQLGLVLLVLATCMQLQSSQTTNSTGSSSPAHSETPVQLTENDFVGGAWRVGADGKPTGNTEVRTLKNLTDSTEEDTQHLVDLNSFVGPYYLGCENADRPASIFTQCGRLVRATVHTQFYITRLPSVGKLFQAYRPGEDTCSAVYPKSCDVNIVCCGHKIFTNYKPDGSPEDTCCAKTSNLDIGGQRVFLVGDEITSVPAKVGTCAHAQANLMLFALLRVCAC